MKYIPKLQLGDQLNLLRKVSKSNTDFINRLKQPNRDVIKDWASPNIATHKMSWATDDKGAVIYPQVQNINGKLTDFTRPPYNKWAGLDSAIERGDTLKTTPETADWFTRNYKNFFPKFQKGGIIPKLQTAWSPLTLTPEKEQAAQKLIQQRALQGYNTSGVNWLKETPEITSKRKALAAKQQAEYQNKRFANRTNEVPINGMPAATQIGLKNVHPEFALMTGGVGSGMAGIKGAMGYGAIQGGLWNSAGIAGEQNLGGLVGDVIGGGIAGGVIKGASPYVKKGVQRFSKYSSNYNNLRDIEIPRFKSFTNSFSDRKALQTASDQFTKRNTFYRGVKGAESLDEAAQMLTTVDGKIRPNLRQGIPEGNNSGVIYSSVNPKRAEIFAGPQGYVGKVTPTQIKGNNLTEFIDNNLIGNRKDLLFNKQIDGTPQLISFGNPQQQVMNLEGFVGSSNKLPITNPLINRNSSKVISKSIVSQNSELVRPITPTFWQDMYNATKQGIIESREVISNPIVQNTIRKNIETYKRLKPQAVVNENLGEIMQDLSKRKIYPKFTELDDVTSGQLVDRGGETVDGYFNTQPWNALKPLQHHEATGFHEGLHIGRFGSYPIARDKVNRLYKPNSEWTNKDNASYILDNISGEGVVNTYEMGKRAGLKIGQSYPGIDKFKEMLQNTNFGEKIEFAKMLKLDTPRDYKRVWDAMTGKYFVAPIAMTAGYKLTQNKKE